MGHRNGEEMKIAHVPLLLRVLLVLLGGHLGRLLDLNFIHQRPASKLPSLKHSSSYPHLLLLVNTTT